MILVEHELVTGGFLTQYMTVGDRHQMLHAIRAHLVKVGSPSGSLYLEIGDESSGVIAVSNTITIASMGGTPHFHGYVRFLIDLGLKSGTTYGITLKSTGGYTFSDSDHIGWCTDWDLRKYDRDYTPDGDNFAALDMEIWTRSLVEKGVS